MTATPTRLVLCTLLLAALALPAAADEQADRMRAAVERHGGALVRVEATTAILTAGLPGLGGGVRRTQQVSSTAVAVGPDGLVVFPALALDPARGAFALLGTPGRAEVLALSVVTADGHVHEAEWIGRDPQLGLAFARVGETGRPALRPVTFAAPRGPPALGAPLLVLTRSGAELGRAVSCDPARVSLVGKAGAEGPLLVGLTPPLPHALGGLAVSEAGEPVGLISTHPAALEGGDVLRPDLLAQAWTGYLLPAPALQPVRETPTGAVARGFPWLGVKHEVLTPELAQAHGLAVDVGVLVVEVYPDSPAAKAGLQAGDVLAELEGELLDLDPGESFEAIIESYEVGTQVPFTVRRGDQDQQVEVTLERGPVRPAFAERLALPELGLLLRALTFYDRAERQLPPEQRGALVLELAPDGAASRAGLRPADIVVAVDGEPLQSLEDARTRLTPPGEHRVKVRRGGEEVELRVRR